MTQTITNVPQLKFNKMSNEKYQELLAKGELVANEFYITPDSINGEDVPTKVSDLENDLGFITSQDIEGKADKNDTYTKSEIDEDIESLGTSIGNLQSQVNNKANSDNVYTKSEVDTLLNERFQIVDELPENPDPNVFYFIKE